MVKNLPAHAGDAGDAGLIPGLGISSREGNDNLLPYSCLENFMENFNHTAWQATVHRVTESWTWLSMHTPHPN